MIVFAVFGLLSIFASLMGLVSGYTSNPIVTFIVVGVFSRGMGNADIAISRRTHPVAFYSWIIVEILLGGILLYVGLAPYVDFI